MMRNFKNLRLEHNLYWWGYLLRKKWEEENYYKDEGVQLTVRRKHLVKRKSSTERKIIAEKRVE